MIFFNARRYLAEAMESVVSQSWTDWELILVDDGSTDGGEEIAHAYQKRLPEKIVYLTHEGRVNRGMSASRNLGIRNATGKYLLMLDADDALAPDALEQQVRILERNADIGMVYAAALWWYSWSGRPEDRDSDFVKGLGFPADTVIQPPFLLEKMVRNEACKPCGGLVRRELAEKVGGYEEEFRGMYEDQVFLAKVALRAPVLASSGCWYRYRKHEDSCCLQAVAHAEYRKARARYLAWLDGYLETGPGDCPQQLRALIRSELFRARHPRLAGWQRRLINGLKGSGTSKSFAGSLGRSRTIARLRLALRGRAFTPPAGRVRFGDLRRLQPFSRRWGFERGLPIDRVYIEQFLERHQDEIRGTVLEVANSGYTKRFGANRVHRSEVVSIEPGPGVTIVTDLAAADSIPSNVFDCIILTQTLQLIYDLRSAVCHLHRVLKPGGVLLASVPGITSVAHQDVTRAAEQWCWSFACGSVRKLFSEFFGERVEIETFGNVLTAAAFLYGLAAPDLRPSDFLYRDPDYPMIIAVRATKADR